MWAVPGSESTISAGEKNTFAWNFNGRLPSFYFLNQAPCGLCQEVNPPFPLAKNILLFGISMEDFLAFNFLNHAPCGLCQEVNPPFPLVKKTLLLGISMEDFLAFYFLNHAPCVLCQEVNPPFPLAKNILLLRISLEDTSLKNNSV
jgi:hypothetical protein